MSDCGVCVTSGENDDCTGYRCVIVKAGKDWTCSECGRKIPKGTKYELASWFFYSGGGNNAKTCLICAEIANAFQCGGRWHGQDFWDRMEDVYEKLTTSCFDKLKTPEAKSELRYRWMRWKGLVA